MQTVRPRSAFASVQSDQGLRFPLTESLDTIECISGEQVPGLDSKYAWDESESVFCEWGHLFVGTVHMMYKGV